MWMRSNDKIKKYDIDGNYVLVEKGNVLVFGNGEIGKVIGVDFDYSHHNKALCWFPCGETPHTNAPSLQHSVVLKGAVIFQSRFDNKELGFKKGDYICKFKGKYFKKLPISAYNDELNNAVRECFNDDTKPNQIVATWYKVDSNSTVDKMENVERVKVVNEDIDTITLATGEVVSQRSSKCVYCPSVFFAKYVLNNPSCYFS